VTDKPKKKSKGISPTARALAECRKRGYIAQVVERRIPYQFVTIDLFGCIDIIAITPTDIIGIQATGGDSGNHAARVHKILAEPRAMAWLNTGARLEVWSFAKRGERGTRKLWTLREQAITVDDFAAASEAA
jgi:hypothetical protein